MRSRISATWVRRRVVRGATALVVLGLLSCSDGSVATQPTLATDELFWALELDQHAVTLALEAPYDTFTVVAMPRNPAGEALAGLGAVTWRSADLARVQVSPEGVLQAVAVAHRVPVVAELYARGVTHVDTVFVGVTATAPVRPVTSLSIDPIPPDSAKFAVSSRFKLIVPIMTDVDGASVPGVAVDLKSLDPEVATIDRASGVVSPNDMGRVRFVATATAYGVPLADTVTYTVGLPLQVGIFIWDGATVGALTRTAFASTSTRIAAGGTVVWVWETLTPTDLTFDDPTFVEESPDGYFGLGANTGAGNIPAPPCGPANVLECYKARRFPVPGVYRYRSTLTGAQGEIIVEAEEPATS